MPAALKTIGITKQFPGVLANDHIDFGLERGEIHALLGENGAGKSTLMNILYGLYAPDSGQILINGAEVHLQSPNDAIARGIGMVHQHFMLIPPLTVTENIILGNETLRPATRVLGRLALLDRPPAAQRIADLSAQYSLAVDPQAHVKDLTVGAQQRVEIIKALYRNADILILDEPTAVLTPQEADELFDIMRGLAKQGKSIIFITHKLREVFAVADRITVLRLGKKIGTVPAQGATQEQLAEMMVGRKVILSVEKRDKEPGVPSLSVAGLTVLNDRRLVSVSDVSFDVHGGEVLGIAGVQGNGQTELADALTSLRKVESGTIRLLGHDITHASPREVIEAGVAHIPEDRQKHGLVLSYPVADNLVLSTYYLPPFSRGIELDEHAIEANARTLIQKYDIRTPSPLTSAGSLSGGNQQKVIVARELSRVTQVIIAVQPTRGLDVGSIEFIHKQLVAARDMGVAVLLISAELDEILALSDRIAVMYKGTILDVLPAREATREKLGLLMAGVKT
jgi:general nucleoside transport system ATP-binding protein